MSTEYGRAVCYGLSMAELPIANLPPGVLKVRKRFRNDKAAVAYLKFEDRIGKWILSPFEDGRPKPGETFSNVSKVWLIMHQGTNAIR